LVYYLAVDIGASGGRHILGCLENGKLITEEVYRFENGVVKKNGSLCWDLENIFNEIINGLKQCAQIGKIPSFMGIDTWGVDFVLLNDKDQIIGETACYRDSRTQGMDDLVYKKIPLEKLYERTGIQRQIFNTIYQLTAVKTKHPHYLEEAKTLLMIPDYFNFLLTGIKKTEYTNATTTQLVNVKTKNWDDELLDVLGFKRELFQEISMAGDSLGSFLPEIQELAGFNCEVLLPATHDTACAVAAVPAVSENVVYLSSGTWSLMGIERQNADCSPERMKFGFTNEGGYDYRFRFLKNIMGLWMIQ
jgi:rhamnulokinase